MHHSTPDEPKFTSPSTCHRGSLTKISEFVTNWPGDPKISSSGQQMSESTIMELRAPELSPTHCSAMDVIGPLQWHPGVGHLRGCVIDCGPRAIPRTDKKFQNIFGPARGVLGEANGAMYHPTQAAGAAKL